MKVENNKINIFQKLALLNPHNYVYFDAFCLTPGPVSTTNDIIN